MDKYRALMNKIEAMKAENEKTIKEAGGTELDSFAAGVDAALYAVQKEAEKIEISEKVLINYEKRDWVRKNRLFLIQNGWIEKDRLIKAIELQIKKKEEKKKKKKKSKEIKVDMIDCKQADNKTVEAVRKFMEDLD